MDAPAATSTPLGGWATDESELLKLMLAPPAGAGWFKVTVAVTETPEATDGALRLNPVKPIGVGVRVRRAVLVSFLYPPVAEIVAEPVVSAPFVAIGNVPVLAAAGIVTFGGRVATFVSELASVMTRPAAGAFPESQTVPVEGAPATRLKGLRVMDARMAGSTVKVPLLMTPPYVPEMVMATESPTPTVGIVNEAEVELAGTVTLAGTEATVGSELVRATVRPPAGAAVAIVTVPVALSPPEMTAGVTETLVRVEGSGVTTRVAQRPDTLYHAPMETLVVETTGYVVTGKLALVAPAGIVTPAGTVATEVRELPRVRLSPPNGALPFNVTVPVQASPA